MWCRLVYLVKDSSYDCIEMIISCRANLWSMIFYCLAQLTSGNYFLQFMLKHESQCKVGSYGWRKGYAWSSFEINPLNDLRAGKALNLHCMWNVNSTKCPYFDPSLIPHMLYILKQTNSWTRLMCIIMVVTFCHSTFFSFSLFSFNYYPKCFKLIKCKVSHCFTSFAQSCFFIINRAALLYTLRSKLFKWLFQ